MASTQKAQTNMDIDIDIDRGMGIGVDMWLKEGIILSQLPAPG